MEKEGQGDDREGSDSDYDLVPSGDKRGIGKLDIGCNSGPDGDRSGRLGGSEDGWWEGELVHFLQSTKFQAVEGLILLQTQWGRKRPRCLGRQRFGWIER